MTKTTNGGPAAVLCIDPPWRCRDQLPDARGAAHKYTTMSTEEIAAMPLPERAERNVIFLWRLAAMLPDALRVLAAWGYTACAEVVWVKLRVCLECAGTGRVEVWTFGGREVVVPGSDRVCPKCEGRRGVPNMGMGSYTRGCHEVAIVARPKRGRAPERLSLAERSVFEAPMLLDVDGVVETSNGSKGQLVHSAKPDEFFTLVERLYPGPRVELFSRRTRPGWSSTHSDQAGSLDEVARVFREDWPRRVREERLAKARRAAR